MTEPAITAKHRHHGLKVPSEELARQAVDALRGYAYQIYQSLFAWIALEPTQELHLEVAEDYAVLAERACSVVQVKDAPSSSVTLNSLSIRKAIQSLWNLPGGKCQLRVAVPVSHNGSNWQGAAARFSEWAGGTVVSRRTARVRWVTPAQSKDSWRAAIFPTSCCASLAVQPPSSSVNGFQDRICRLIVELTTLSRFDKKSTIASVHHGQKFGISRRSRKSR